MKIVTWNINGVRARIENLVAWLKESDPDIVCLQEIKCQDDAFPRLEVEAAGYHVETHGQKGFNGVAILSKIKPDEVNRGLPGDDADEQARFIEGVFSVDGGAIRVCSLYLPNGNPPDDPVKYDFSLCHLGMANQCGFRRGQADARCPLRGLCRPRSRGARPRARGTVRASSRPSRRR